MFDIEQLRRLPWVARALHEVENDYTPTACINYAQGWIQGVRVGLIGAEPSDLKTIVLEGSKCDSRLAAGLFWSAELIQAGMDLEHGATRQ